MRPDQLEAPLRERLDALGSAPRADLLRILMLPDFERVGAIGSYWAIRRPAPSGELLIDWDGQNPAGGARRDAAGN
jgi:hypothetical protein